jgi:pimeloyl-ACP methyl ester carboxylesterase
MAFDLRGHGLSSKPDRGYAWAEEHGADVVNFINHNMEVLPWLYLKGISTGGMQEALEALLGQEATSFDLSPHIACHST